MLVISKVSYKMPFLKTPGLPFQVGDLAESRTFQAGYRGAWFRCKIRGIRSSNGLAAHLEYFDYPDQKLTWCKLYQKNVNRTGFDKELMMRPSFPTIYRESENLDVNTITDVIVIVNNVWKVGDLVDWWSDGCYWSGTVTEILDNGKVQIDLLPRPVGEGLSYEALSKDLRPSLHWCPEKGWTVPMPMEDGNSRPCARIINPANSARTYSSQNSEGQLDSSNGSMGKRKQCDGVSNGMEIDNSDNKMRKTFFPDSVSSGSHTMDSSNEINDRHPSKMRCNTSLCLNSMSSNTIEAAILDLEELVNRIKWLRGVLGFGVPLSATKQVSWKFLNH